MVLFRSTNLLQYDRGVQSVPRAIRPKCRSRCSDALQGSTARWVYERKDNVRYNNDAYRGELAVGTIKAKDLDTVDQLLQSRIELRHNDLNWNCQNWCFRALSVLFGHGHSIQRYEDFKYLQMVMIDVRDTWRRNGSN